MKKALLALAMAVLPVSCTTSDAIVLGEVLGGISGSPAAQGVLSSAEIDAGLREALTIGTNLVSTQLGQTDGYFSDPNIKIPLPQTYQRIQNNLRLVGASGLLDDLELRLNRAAEDAIPDAKRLVIGAVQQITIEDALQILNGGDTAATDFLRGKTESQLRSAFTPFLRTSLAESGAFSTVENIAGQYGLGGVSSQLQSDMTGHAVQFGLDGLFFYVAEEEKKIRENPVARTTEILRRVFG